MVEFTKDMLKTAHKLNKKVKDAIELEAILVHSGLCEHYSPASMMDNVFNSAIISGARTTKEHADKCRLLKKSVPGIVSSRNKIDMWSPYGDTVIISADYIATQHSNIKIRVWLKTDIQHIPEQYQSDKCKFVEETRKSYTLECKL